MATSNPAQSNTAQQSQSRRIDGRPAPNLRLDWWIAMTSCLILFGLFIDGWAHNHGRVDNSFFTPWHGILYGAYALSGIILVGTHFRNVNKGYAWASALPDGYMLSIIGVFLFAFAGGADMLWHEAFGFEEDLETLLSPSHLTLAFGALLIITGPIRSLWNRQTDSSWRTMLPVVLAFLTVASVLTFFMQYTAITGYLYFLTGDHPKDGWLEVDGIMNFVVHSGILMAVVLFMIRRWKLPFGSLTILFGVNSVLMAWIHLSETAEFLFFVSAIIAGLLGDILLTRISNQTPNGMRFFAFIVPFVYILGTFAIVQFLGTSVWDVGGLWWKVHMWLGIPIVCGVLGFFLSLLVFPPHIPNESA